MWRHRCVQRASCNLTRFGWCNSCTRLSDRPRLDSSLGRDAELWDGREPQNGGCLQTCLPDPVYSWSCSRPQRRGSGERAEPPSPHLSLSDYSALLKFTLPACAKPPLKASLLSNDIVTESRVTLLL
ncbi:hypothetical protein SKAU_G00233500 [Synaphobranchus kaupii]|uniref:Uncharacterized protein n=1 Tax=Synaphobranchus kaupii TaxID=118154 RepID=A0A9Q1F656_SYNKA|nr:hypothetical protein SKAU_G00233500 [Synaphobranchus kaupii]